MSDKEGKTGRRDITDRDVDPTTGVANPTPKTGTNSSIDMQPGQGKKMGKDAAGKTGGSRAGNS